MAGLSKTLHGPSPAGASNNGGLRPLPSFGSNPGNLTAYQYLPDPAPARLPLVVVLHGCTQNAAAYDHGSGWSALADRHGFALLFPEQQRANNPNLCFNWFDPRDVKRDSGELLSIRHMIDHMVQAHAIDESRIFVTGLSAGGAMAAALLANYPDVFAGGAIIAGIPYGTATNVPQALERMRGQGGPKGADIAALVTGMATTGAAAPTISVWHGDSDRTVSIANAQSIIDQWAPHHGVDRSAFTADLLDGHARRRWRDARDRVVIEEHIIAGMGHGTPLRTAAPDGYGQAGPHMLEAGISSTLRIAQSWGIVPSSRPTMARTPARPAKAPTSAHGGSIQRIIQDALTAAGLMK